MVYFFSLIFVNKFNLINFRSYPSVSEDQEEILILRSNLKNDTIPLPFTYSKYKNNWVYIRITSMDSEKIVAFGICLISSVKLNFLKYN